MQILMELIGAGLLIFLVVKGIDAMWPAPKQETKKEDPQTTKTQTEQE